MFNLMHYSLMKFHFPLLSNEFLYFVFIAQIVGLEKQIPSPSWICKAEIYSITQPC